MSKKKRVMEGCLKRKKRAKRGIVREGKRGQPAAYPRTGTVEAWLAHPPSHQPLFQPPPSHHRPAAATAGKKQTTTHTHMN